jgi:hypothetical protein
LVAKLHSDHPELARGYALVADLSVARGDLTRALRAMREQDARDPAAIGVATNRCYYLLRFGALGEARRCLDALEDNAPDSTGVGFFMPVVKAWSGDWAGAEAAMERSSAPDNGFKAYVLTALGRNAEALAIYRRVAPELLVDPPGKIYPGQAQDATNIGSALLHNGAQAQGRALLQKALLAQALRPRVMDGFEWNDVTIHVALGEQEQAITALKRGIADGYFLDLAYLDSDPLLAEFRKDPRYQKILAPARAKAAAQVAAARTSGLL